MAACISTIIINVIAMYDGSSIARRYEWPAPAYLEGVDVEEDDLVVGVKFTS